MEDTSLFKDFVKESQEHRSWGQKLLDSMKALLAKIRRKFRSAKAADEAMVAATGKTVSQVEKALELWEKALAETKEAVQHSDRRIRPEEAQKTTAQSGGKMSKNLEEWAVRTAVAEALDHKADRNNSLISLGSIPSLLSNIVGTNAELYVRANHVYENAVSKERAVKDGRIRKNAHYHNLGEETIIDAIMALENPAMLISDATNTNPTIVALLPVRSGENMVYAALSFYSSDPISGDYSKRPHIVLTLSPIPLTSKDGRKNLTDTISSAVLGKSIIFYDKKMTATLPVNAQNASLGIVTDASVRNNLAHFQKNVKAFKEKNNIRYSLNLDYMDAVNRGDTEAAQKLVDEAAKQAGYTIHAYHGTSRGDRVGNVFLPERATSGPMAFFTSDPDIAKHYANDKADTSLAYDEEYTDYYTQFRVNQNGKSIKVQDLWRILSFAERARLKEAGKHITWDENMENPVWNDAATNGLGNWDAYTLNQHRGNAIEALIDCWLESGELYGNEGDFIKVLELAGINGVEYRDPDVKHEKVYDVYLKIQNPFDTSTVNDEFADGFEQWFSQQSAGKYDRDTSAADMWDKNSHSAEWFLDKLRDDIANGTAYAWTSIPDSMTDYLKSLGYDGIQDKGGKFSGESHTVYIPFTSEQVKETAAVTYDDNGNVIPLSERFNSESRDIRYSLEATEGILEEELELWEKALAETREAVQRSDRRIRPEEAQKTTAQSGGKMSLVVVNGKYYEPSLREISSNHPNISVANILGAKYQPGIALGDAEYKAYRRSKEAEARNAFGEYTNRDTAYSSEYGEIKAEFGAKAVRKGKSYGGVALFDILPHIGEIFEKAVVVRTKADRANDANIRGIVELVGGAILGGNNLAVVKLNVIEYTSNEAKIYDNRVIEIEELTVVGGIQNQIGTEKSPAVSSEYILGAYYDFVNKKYSIDIDLSDETDSQGNRLSNGQKEYFSGSKVRDENGHLLPVYHGTAAIFNEFSYDFINTHGSSEGRGFYFTDKQSMAEGYSKDSGRVMAGYLDIRKPLSNTERTITRQEVTRLIKAVDPTGDDLLANYDPTGGMGYPSRAWYNRALRDTVDIIMENDTDSDLLAEIANGGAGNASVMQLAHDLLGYDGYIERGKYDGASVFVAFDSSQFKDLDNRNPTKSKDIRYSLEATEGILEEELELWEKALAETREAVQRSDRRIRPEEAQKTTAQSGGKMSLDLDNFASQVDNINQIPSGEALVVCGTPSVFLDIGLNNLPMTLNLEHAKDAITMNPAHKDRYIGETALKDLPRALKEPVAIITSSSQAGSSLVAIVDLKGQNGKSVIAPVYVNGLSRSNGIMMDVNAIASVHERRNAVKGLLMDAINAEANGNIGVFYVDNKKATQLIRGEGLQLPNIFTSMNGFMHSITENGSPVKGQFREIPQTETKQFKRWFGKSKVVDEDGNPLVVYHGTDSEFSVFDMSKGRANMDIQGAFFSPYEIDAGGYGKNVGSYYLSIKNPADESTAYRALNRFKGQNNAGVKAREYLIQQGYDGVYNGYDEYIAFYPEQIKSATDNIGTFDGSNPDIRYSLEATEGILEEELELAQLQRSTVDRLQYLRKQVAVTKDATADPQSVERIAKKLITRYGVEMDADDLAGKLRPPAEKYLDNTLTKRKKSITIIHHIL